ncbi:MAG: hypothetical protein ACE5GV_11955 [Candidatus Scalindua sp.]
MQSTPLRGASNNALIRATQATGCAGGTDYVISLAFADALATNETKGELSRYVDWMYGTSKKVISFRNTSEEGI